ncbi:hypothetical protein HJG60_009527 [Phyllostomus discolor]|uniref:Uncharacterized protein n=1 Tax=Phyllostomus discolor TaxID=89673 RepID=A0A833YJ06_9CHIR|nr:hypothetical protein HJG60_009527 [Phyllostomus discolor]
MEGWGDGTGWGVLPGPRCLEPQGAQHWKCQSACALCPCSAVPVTEGEAAPRQCFPSMHRLSAAPGTTQSVPWTGAQADQGCCTPCIPPSARGLFSSWPQNMTATGLLCHRHSGVLNFGLEAQEWRPIFLGWPNLGSVLGAKEVARGCWSGVRG